MAKRAAPAPCPKCARPVLITPHQGGRGSGECTCYEVECPCGVHESFLGGNTGRMATAIADWNRWVKNQQLSQRLPVAPHKEK